MKRWFVSRMITDTETGERYPAVARHSSDFRVWSNDESDMCIGQVAFRNIGPLQADPDIQLFPDQMLLDFRWDTVGASARNAVLTKAAALGFNTAGIGPSAVNRDVLHALVHQVQAGVNIESGDVRDPWG